MEETLQHQSLGAIHGSVLFLLCSMQFSLKETPLMLQVLAQMVPSNGENLTSTLGPGLDVFPAGMVIPTHSNPYSQVPRLEELESPEFLS